VISDTQNGRRASRFPFIDAMNRLGLRLSELTTILLRHRQAYSRRVRNGLKLMSAGFYRPRILLNATGPIADRWGLSMDDKSASSAVAALEMR